MIKSINLFALVVVPLALWLGISGRVDWVILGFILLTHCDITYTFRRKGIKK